MSSAKPILGYWDIRGLGAPIRHLLVYAGVDFTDKRYSKEQSKEWFEKDKHTLGLDFPNLPYFIDGPTKLTQSLTILRHLARRYNLAGRSDEEKNAISLVEQQIVDLDNECVAVAYSPSAEDLKGEYITTKLPAGLQLLSAFMAGRSFVAGDTLSYVDFWLYEYLKRTSTMIPQSVDPFPNLIDFISRIESLPKLGEYLKATAKPGLFFSFDAFWNATA